MPGVRRESGQPTRQVPMKIAVVIPCYKVAGSILDVIASIGPEVSAIYVVDDACPQSSGNLVQEQCDDTRVRVLFHNRNQGVGGAVITGYQEAVQDGADIIVKLDGDGQMDAGLIPYFVEPIQTGEADYTKGNRFYEIESVTRMPAVRMIGNAGLSFLTKLSSGYWGLFDPTNGFTAISARVVAYLPLDKLARGYFFESDMLFRLNTLRAVVVDLPADAIYGDEISNLKIVKELPRFAVKNLTNFCKRILYNYFIRGFNYASLELVLGIGLTGFGVIFGLVHWLRGLQMESFASAGTVMLAGLSIMIGIQMLLGFLQYDISNQPTMALQRKIRPRALDRQQSHKKRSAP
ncbi:MAG: glycosyltransferase family 2 protein [Pseudomonadales bacterium]|nr:glycosyltransferase family 2 protein [Pseudomonadales bacterium]